MGKKLLLKRSKRLVDATCAQATTKDKQQCLIVCNTQLLPRGGSVSRKNTLTYRITGNHNSVLSLDVALKSLASLWEGNAYLRSFTSRNAISKTCYRVLLVNQIRDVQLSAKLKQWQLNIGSKANSNIRSSLLSETLVKLRLCAFKIVCRANKRPRAPAIKAIYMDRYQLKSCLRHQRTLKLIGLTVKRNLVTTLTELLSQSQSWVNVTCGSTCSNCNREFLLFCHAIHLLEISYRRGLVLFPRSLSDAEGPKSILRLPEASVVIRP